MEQVLEQIQQDILDPDVKLSNILLKAKLLAHQLKNDSFKNWVKYEIDGYPAPKDIPDYRIISTPLLGYIHNGYNGYSNLPISLSNTPDWFQEVAGVVHFTSGIQTVEELSSQSDSISFDWPADWIQVWNHYNPLGHGGHQCWEVKRPVSPSVFVQILLTVRSRLQDFVLELGDIPWKLVKEAPIQEQVERLVSVAIFNNNNAQGGTVSTFDQRGQQVSSQNNAAGDIRISGGINIQAVQSANDLIAELQKVKRELSNVSDSQVIDAEIVTDADFEIATAIQEAKKKTPSKETIGQHLQKAKTLLSTTAEAAGFVTAITKLIEALNNIF